MEASAISEWVARILEELGHEVVVADPNYTPMYAQRSRRVKTDKRDARALLGVRDKLVRTRAGLVTLAQALLSREGIRVPTWSLRGS